MSVDWAKAVHLWFAPSVIWVALVALVALTVGSAFVPLGLFNGVINAGVAGANRWKFAIAAKAGLHEDCRPMGHALARAPGSCRLQALEIANSLPGEQF